MKRSFLLATVLVVYAALTLPYLLAARSGGRDLLFIGFLFNPIDGASYLAKMYQGWAGSWRFTLPYTAGAQESAYIFLYYLFLGHLARWTGISLIWMFHLARLVGAGLLLTGLHRFFLTAFKDRPDFFNRAFFWVAVGSGMGWLVVFFGPLPADFWVAEAYPFLSMYANSHFPLGLALLVWAFTLLVSVESPFRCLKLALLGLLMAAILQFGLVVALVVAAAWSAWTWLETRRLEWRPVASLAILGGPFLLYQYLSILADPVLAGWNAQNLTPNPPAWDLMLSFSPALPLAAWGSLQVLGRWKQPMSRLLLAWLVLGGLLVMIPFPLQRRFMLGYYIPVVALAVFGLADLLQRRPGWRRWFPALVLALALPTSFLLVVTGIGGAAAHDPILYMTADEARGLDWIRARTPPQAVILASPETGRLIPAFTGRQVLYGHPFETLDAAQEEARVTAFFQGQGWDDSLERLLTARQIDYIYYGPREQALGGSMDLSRQPLVFESGLVRIYAVEQER